MLLKTAKMAELNKTYTDFPSVKIDFLLMHTPLINRSSFTPLRVGLTILLASSSLQADSSDLWICKGKSVNKTVEVIYPTGKPLPCYVLYGRDTENADNKRRLWRSQNTLSFCQQKAISTVKKLEYGGYQCVQAEPVSIPASEDSFMALLKLPPPGAGGETDLQKQEKVTNHTRSTSSQKSKLPYESTSIPCVPDKLLILDNNQTSEFKALAIEKQLNWGRLPHYEISLLPDGKIKIQHLGIVYSNLFSAGGGVTDSKSATATGLRYVYTNAASGQLASIEIDEDLQFRAYGDNGMQASGKCDPNFYQQLPLLTRPDWR